MISYEEFILGHNVNLPEMLYGREKRAEKQREFLIDNDLLVCFSLNIPGPIKSFSICNELFRIGDKEIRKVLEENKVIINDIRIDKNPWGWEAFYAISSEAIYIKKLMTSLEDTVNGGRLFDIDVIYSTVGKVSRQMLKQGERSCFVCGNTGRSCARSRNHSLEQLQNVAVSIIIEALKERLLSPELVGEICALSLLHEVYTTPKPGLVDLNNNGSHKDMNVLSFERSIEALKPFYTSFFDLGRAFHNIPKKNLLEKLRPEGIEAEEAMRKATNGVNTHKGAIYSLGLLAAAFGYLTGNGISTVRLDDLLDTVSEIASSNSFKTECCQLSHGVSQYIKYGLGGAREEAAKGFPTMRKYALPELIRGINKGLRLEEAGTSAFMSLLANLDDSNMIARGGLEEANNVKERIKRHKGNYSKEWIEELDAEFIEKNLSPGGCADMLAMSYFVMLMAELGKIIL